MITLGIIGVVASITIPQVIANYTKKVTVNKLKKNYAVIQQAIKRSEIDNEPLQSWDFSLSGQNFFERYLKNYFANATEIPSIDVIGTKRKFLNGMDCTDAICRDESITFHFLINDGSMLSIKREAKNDGGALRVGIDVNGFAEPNMVGKDIFLFYYTAQYGLRPMGDLGTPMLCNNCTRAMLMNSTRSNFNCNKERQGELCAYLIMLDGWKIRKDYPW